MDEAKEGLYRCCQGCQVSELVGIGGRKPDRHTRDAECTCREVVEQMRSAAVASQFHFWPAWKGCLSA